MREPARDEDDVCWGGRKWQFKNEAQKLWLERCAAKGWTVPEWPAAYGGGGLEREQAKMLARGDEPHQRAPRRCPASASGCWARRC
jgi:acyl-CoA dehydrogenase